MSDFSHKYLPVRSFGFFIVLAALFWREGAAEAAEITWSAPAPVKDDRDVSILWKAERAYSFGSARPETTVYGVTFKPFGDDAQSGPAPARLEGTNLLLAVAGDGDGLRCFTNQLGRGLKGLSPQYKTLLQSGVADKDSALALVLDGLTVSNTYLVQLWVNDSRDTNHTESFRSGGGASPPVEANTADKPGGAGQSVIGVFTADHASQTITINPEGASAQLNALQLRVTAGNSPPLITKQPESLTQYTGNKAVLSVRAWGKPPLTYHWFQMVTNSSNGHPATNWIANATNAVLTFAKLGLTNAGNYQALVGNPNGFVASTQACLTVLPPPADQLVNIHILSGSSYAPTYVGQAVLPGSDGDDWNRIGGGAALAKHPLVDSTGAATPVTLTIVKTNGFGWENKKAHHRLLADYSGARGTSQTVILRHLKANSAYDLAVYSIGTGTNEGGVFSGAVTGVCSGYDGVQTNAWSEFIPGINYLENPHALSDADGTLIFTLTPTDKAMADKQAKAVCAINGLQFRKAAAPAVPELSPATTGATNGVSP